MLSKRIFLLVGLVLIFMALHFTSAVTTISSCNTVITSAESYQLNQSISINGTCIYIRADNVNLDCGGFNITYGAAGGTSAFGINASDGAILHSNLTIRNCLIDKNSTLGTSGYGIFLAGYNNSLIYNNTINTNGVSDNYGVSLKANSTENTITGNTIRSTGSTANNFGIFINQSDSSNNISYNFITTNGTATNYGIYLLGLTTAGVNYNTISSNNITTLGTGASNFGIYLTANANNNNVTNNTLATSGTTLNYGIYVFGTTTATVTNNTVSSNNVRTSGSGISNHGIYVSTNASSNIVNYNNLIVNGSTTNYGIYLLGAANANTNNNLVDSNNVSVVGTAAAVSNIGLFVSTNANSNNVTNNNVTVYGTTNNQGMEVLGTAALTTNYTLISSNSFVVNGSAAAAATDYGIYVTTNTNSNNISYNTVTTAGSTTGYGIFLVGTAASAVNYNIISSNNVTTIGTGASNDGIPLSTNTNSNNVTNNTVTTSGTTLSYGIYLVGTATGNVDNNIVSSNNVRTSGSGISNHGIYVSTNASSNTVTYNSVIANGSTTNYGIYLLGAANANTDFNLVDSNNVSVVGTAAAVSNIGLFLFTNTNSNNITNNIISTNGTTNNQGIEVLGTAALASNGNLITSNNIYVNGSVATTGATDYGIYLVTDANLNNISYNTITTIGNTTGYGIHLLGTTSPVDYNLIDSNNITTRGGGASNNGIYLLNNANQNIVSNNILSTNGTLTNYGIALTGSSGNNVTQNTITTTGTAISNDAFFISGASTYNTLANNIVTSALGNGFQFIFATNSPNNNALQNNSLSQINGTFLLIASPEINNLVLIDQPIGNYSFTSSGSRNVVFQDSLYGQINFTNALTGLGSNLSSNILINNNSISVNSSNTNLTKSANLIFFNMPSFRAPIALRDDQPCSSTICSNLIIMGNGQIGLSVTGFSNYSIAEAAPPIIQIITPINESNITSQNITFQFNMTEQNFNSTNCSLYINSTFYANNDTTINGAVTQFIINGLDQGKYSWNITCVDDYGASNTSETNVFNVIASSSQTLDYPINNSYFNNQNLVSLNYTVYDSVLNNLTVWLYGDGILLNSSNDIINSTSLTYNWDNLNLGIHNWTVISNNGIFNYSNTNYFNIINFTINCQAAGPYQSNPLISIYGNVSDGINGLNSQPVNISIYHEGILNISKSLNSLSDGSFQSVFSGLADGNYSINASSSYQGYNNSCTTNFSVGLDPSPPSFILDKLVSLQNINSTYASYNITLRITNKGGSNATGIILSDSDSSSSPYIIGNLAPGYTSLISYIESYQRNSTNYNISLSIASVNGSDAPSGSQLSANSSLIYVLVPQTETGQQLTLIKNIYFNSENSTQANYTLTTEVVNSGGVDLNDIIIDDQDINLTTTQSLNKSQSYINSGSIVIDKEATNLEYSFFKTTGTVNSVQYDSNQIKIVIPGYGGPADTIVNAPSSIINSIDFDSTIEIINQNPDIGQNFVLDYWITSNDESINYTSGEKTIYVAASSSINTTVNLTSPDTPGTYKLKASVSYLGGPDLAFDSFEVVENPEIPETPNSPSNTGSSGGSIVTGQVTNEIVCPTPYMRYGKECCLDVNNNSICDSDETVTNNKEQENNSNETNSILTGHVTGEYYFLENIKNTINKIIGFFALTKLILQNKNYLFISLGTLFILMGIIILISIKVKRKPKDVTRLNNTKGIKVYTEDGDYFGKIKEVYLKDNKIYGWVILLNKKLNKKIKNRNILIRHKNVISIKNVMIINTPDYENLEKIE